MERKWWTLVAVCLAMFMLLLDITIVNVALPDIQRDLHSSFADLQWVVDAYALTLAALLLAAGSLGDRLGYRRVWLTGLVVFTVASLLCGLAGTPLLLNLARGLQGVGGAVMFATSLALLVNEFQGRDRGTAFGVWGATVGGAVAVGPLVGGAVTEGLGWEWIFFINIPIGALTMWLSLTRLREFRNPHAAPIDWAGVVTWSAALGMLVFGLIRGNAEGWGSPLIVGLLVGSAAMLALFLAVERRQEHPMLDLTLFRKPTFTGVSIAAFTLSASMFAMFLYLTLYIQNILGYAPFQAGLRFLPITALAFFVAPVAGKLAARYPVRIFLGLGLGLVGLGLLLMHGVTATSRWTALLAGFIVAGLGIGTANAPIASAAVAVVEPQRSGMASGINSTFRQVGIATGIAGLGAIFQARVEHKVAELLAGTPAADRASDLGHAVASGGAQQAIASVPPGVRATVAQATRDAFVVGFNEILLIAAVIAFVGAVLSFILVRSRDFVTSGTTAGRPDAEDAADQPAPA